MSFKKDRNDSVCVSAVRTPFGRFGGFMRDIDIYDLGALPLIDSVRNKIHFEQFP